MSKKISQFKKELLIRIALHLDHMQTADLILLEEMLEQFESNEPLLKQRIVELFEEKYHIELGSDLVEAIEEQMNKVSTETRTVRKRHIKELLMKKFRMLNMIAKFCKVHVSKVDVMKQQEQKQRLLKDLLDEDEENCLDNEEDE